MFQKMHESFNHVNHGEEALLAGQRESKCGKVVGCERLKAEESSFFLLLVLICRGDLFGKGDHNHLLNMTNRQPHDGPKWKKEEEGIVDFMHLGSEKQEELRLVVKIQLGSP